MSGNPMQNLDLDSNRTKASALRHVAALGCDRFELGLFDPNAKPGHPTMIQRTWDVGSIVESLPWLRYQNREGRNIYMRPSGEHDLSMVDDLTAKGIVHMKQQGFDPALVVETSPGNFQAWLKHAERLGKEVSTAAARALAEKFGGDRGAADWRHFGRLAGFTNRKARHLNLETGLYPYVRLIESTGAIYPEAERFVATVKDDLERRRIKRDQLRTRHLANAGSIRDQNLKRIDEFRADARYGGDGTRVDLAYAVYAFARGAGAEQVANAIRSRDLSHKGGERRQDEYVTRTIKKALAAVERGR